MSLGEDRCNFVIMPAVEDKDLRHEIPVTAGAHEGGILVAVMGEGKAKMAKVKIE